MVFVKGGGNYAIAANIARLNLTAVAEMEGQSDSDLRFPIGQPRASHWASFTLVILRLAVKRLVFS
jgi:hypothetical protein